MEISEIGWSKDLETGIEVLDQQHRKYLDLVSDYLENSARAAETPEQLFGLAEKFDFLFQYAKEHFATEEKLMVRLNYPDFPAHHEEHLYFLKHVKILFGQLIAEGYSSDLAREVHYYTVEWFIEHIRMVDMKFVEFLREVTVENDPSES